MMSLSVPHSPPPSPPLQFNPLRMVPSFHRFPQFLCSANLRASMNSRNSRVSVRLRAAHQPVAGKLEMERFASISSSNSSETSSVGVNPHVSAPLQSHSGSPLFWIGVALSALCITAAAILRKYAMPQAFKTLMAEMKSKNDQYTAFSPPTPAATDVKNEAKPNTFGKANSAISVEALENMLKDPEVQNMVYPYFPEEMRNPTTFKWILQNPQCRQQLEDRLGKMTGNSEWDSIKMDSLKNFELSSPEVKPQFDYIGVTPEEVISKVMADPEVAVGFQNPRVQAAIVDCSLNPVSIAKYENDKEVMDIFHKISDLFPDSSGSP